MKQWDHQRAYNVIAFMLLAGIVCHGAGILAANLLYPAESLSVAINPDRIGARIKLLKYTYDICGTCSLIFFFESLILLCRDLELDFKKQAIRYLKLIVAAMICTGIFALVDRADWQNSFFPLWGILCGMGILLIISFVVWLIKRI